MNRLTRSVTDEAQVSAVSRPRRRRRIFAIGLAAIGLGLVGLGLAGWLILALRRPSAPTIPIPNPNGYDDLIQAGRSIGGKPPRFNFQFAQILRPSTGPAARRLDPMNVNWDEAAAYLLANREALAQVRIGLDRECVVPVVYQSGYAYGSNANRELMKALGHLLIWEAQVAVHEGRDSDAARSYLDMVRLGHATSRGGLEVDAWAGLDIETGGLLGLERLSKDLDPATCRGAIAFLREFDSSREPLRASRDRQRACLAAENGRVQSAVRDLLNARSVRAQDDSLDESHREAIAMTRLVRIELAIQAYRSENGHDPVLLDDLVPSVLAEVPLDPFTGRAPIYRATGNGHQLYSLGPDLIDGDGSPLRRATRTRSTGDILPDSIGTTLIP